MKILCTFSLCFISAPLVAQVSTGELRLKLTDSTGPRIKAAVAFSSEANQYFNTRREAQAGLHGQLVLGGGSYDTLQSFGQLQDTWGKNNPTGTSVIDREATTRRHCAGTTKWNQ